ncbi:MAG: ECF transporter S component [Muribaculaceae bacterium]|nr:ECF transporter S component [Alistipes senegalensis]MCM1474251.1 ECF transporter S component [Muribaculaceae bacterium]
MSNANIIEKPHLTVKKQTIATVSAIIGAVVLPQLLHVIGAASGSGTSLGETFLPMHLPVILVGLLAGTVPGAIAGFLSPLVSCLLTGMPGQLMLPFIMIELCAYGAFSGLLKNTKMPDIAKILTAQIAGRALRAIAILIAVYALGNESIKTAVIWDSVVTGIPGLVLQWSLIPLLLHGIGNIKKHE